MTVPRCEFRKSKHRSDVTQLLLILVLISISDYLPLACRGEVSNRDSRKLFGGYRITPSYCKASRTAKHNRGNTICMFNHECAQRGGEVVGACMDGFLFGACCQLKSDSQSHIPKGPGVVMTSYLDYPDPETETDDYDGDSLSAWHNSFKPIVTPGYRPGDKSTSSTEKSAGSNLSTEAVQAEIISEGLSQITNTLLSTPPKDDSYIYIKPIKTDGFYTHSSIDHNTAETVLVNKNGTVVDNIVRPSDFNIQISSMQTKPTSAPSTTAGTTPKTVSTHRPVYSKPIFKPKPSNKTVTTSTSTTKKPSTEDYVMVSTVTKESSKVTELSSINSIIQMLNDSTPSLKEDVTTYASTEALETKSSPTPTVTPVSYSSGYPNYYISTGHYVTLKPSSYPSSTAQTIYSSTTVKYPTSTIKNPSKIPTNTNKYQSSTVKYPSSSVKYPNKKPTFSSKPPYSQTTLNSITQQTKPAKPSKPSKPQFSSPKPSQTSQSIDTFNQYPTDPVDFTDSVTTFSYVSSSTTRTPPPSTTTRRPPSTSYVTGSKPSRRPVTSESTPIPNYDVAPDTFSSVTPTVIVLNGFQTAKPDEKEPQYVEISQAPFKKPVSQITVNTHIESTNNIYMGKPLSYERPSSPTVLITPKPAPNTTPYPIKATVSVRPASVTSPNYDSYTEYYSSTTYKPELQTSPDDLINFPPVRNPMLNATGSNLGIYNTSVAVADINEIDTLHELEFTTPIWQEDEKLNEKMNLFVNKIVGSLQGTFQELHDIVILDKKPNSTIKDTKTTTQKPKRTLATTRKPTTRKPIRLTTTKKTPVRTTKKPTKLTTAARRPTTTVPPATTTKKSATTTKKAKPVKKVTTTTTNPTTTVTELADEVTTENYADQSIDYNDRNLCGVRPLVKTGRIVGGKNAKFGEFPWQVLVRESTWLGLFTKNKCGGVLITSRFVTTAAHCQPGFLASLVAVFGENDISGDLEPRRPVSRNVRRVIVHRQYDAATFENDLALLELESPIKFDAHIVPICMPPDEADFTGRMATVTGWGRLKYGGGVPAVLQEVQVPVIDNSACQEMFQTAGHSKKILSSFICAGYANGQKDSCEGDSGGPLVLQRDDGHWQLVGTVSHGIKCAAPFLPGVYMRTTYYKPWLKSITGVH